MARSAEGVEKIFMNNVMAQPCGGTIVDDSTPQSLRDSSPNLREQLILQIVKGLGRVLSSHPKVGRVRRSRERV